MGAILSLLLLPFRLVGWIIVTIVSLTGRLLAVLLGVGLVALGVVLTLTVVGAIFGIPLVAIGVALILKGIVG